MRIRRHPERTASDAYYAGHVGIGADPYSRLTVWGERLPAPHSPWSTAPRLSYATRSPSAVAPPASKKARLGAVPIKPRCHEALERCGQSSTPVTPFRVAVLSPFPAASTPPCSVGPPPARVGHVLGRALPSWPCRERVLGYAGRCRLWRRHRRASWKSCRRCGRVRSLSVTPKKTVSFIPP